MPSTTNKQAKFMAAVAHSPSFAKKVGVPQSVGRDFNQADKGRKFRGSGSVVKQRINKQDTKHGMLDLPMTNLNRMAGMKGGGSVKRKFADGGELESLDTAQTFKDAFREARNSGVSQFTWRGKKYSTELAKPKASATDTGERAIGNYKAPVSQARAPDSGETAGGAQAGRVSPLSSRMPSEAQKQENSERMGEVVGTAASLLPAGRALNLATRAGRLRDAARAEGTARDWSRMSDMEKARASGGFKKGGSVDNESKGMMKKEVAFMKKKGAPASMVKHEQAEMGAMKMARGGGIERRGKTKGTVVKMAAGGFVRAADGCAQRGKTKGKMV